MLRNSLFRGFPDSKGFVRLVAYGTGSWAQIALPTGDYCLKDAGSPLGFADAYTKIA